MFFRPSLGEETLNIPNFPGTIDRVSWESSPPTILSLGSLHKSSLNLQTFATNATFNTSGVTPCQLGIECAESSKSGWNSHLGVGALIMIEVRPYQTGTHAHGGYGMEFDVKQRLRLFDLCEEGVSFGEHYVVGWSEFDIWVLRYNLPVVHVICIGFLSVMFLGAICFLIFLLTYRKRLKSCARLQGTMTHGGIIHRSPYRRSNDFKPLPMSLISLLCLLAVYFVYRLCCSAYLFMVGLYLLGDILFVFFELIFNTVIMLVLCVLETRYTWDTFFYMCSVVAGNVTWWSQYIFTQTYVLFGCSLLHSRISPEFIIDTGAGEHMVGDSSLLVDLQSTFVRIKGVAGSTMCTQKGTLRGFAMTTAHGMDKVEIKNILVCPHLPVGVNLLSYKRLREKKVAVDLCARPPCVKTKESKFIIFDNAQGLPCMHIKADNVVYDYTISMLGIDTSGGDVPARTEHINVDFNLFHRLYGHVNDKYLQLIAKACKIHLTGVKEPCSACSLSKIKRHAISTTTTNRATKYLERVFIDLGGPVHASIGGSTYFVCIVDDYTRKTFVYFLKNRKAETITAAIDGFLSQNPGVRIVRTDNEGGFTHNSFSKLMDRFSIKHELTPAYSPEYNGVVERRIAIIRILVTTLLAHSQLYGSFRRLWAEAMTHAVDLLNKWPCSANPQFRSPDSMCDKESTSPSFVWGSVCFLLKRGRNAAVKYDFGEHGEKGLYVGRSSTCSKSIRVYKFSTKSVVETPDYIVHNGQHLQTTTSDIVHPDFTSLFSALDQYSVDLDDLESDFSSDTTCGERLFVLGGGDSPSTELHDLNSKSSWSHTDFTPAFRERYPDRMTRSQVRALGNDVAFEGICISSDPSSKSDVISVLEILTTYLEEASDTSAENIKFAFVAASSFVTTPRNYRDAKLSPQSSEWNASMESEINSLINNGTWELVPLPSGANLVKSRWVYLIKYDTDGNVSRYKSRFVARGFSQVHGVDYFDTYAPVVGMTTVRLLLATACNNGWPIFQLDVDTAFLLAPLDEEIYLQQAEGFERGHGLVYKLKKSLYGLKQSPYNWNVEVHSWFVTQGFVANEVDRCLYVRRNGSKVIIMTLFVDDIIITGDDFAGIEDFKSALKLKFPIKDLGHISHCLGLKIDYDIHSRKMCVSQSHYIEKVLDRFGMIGCYPLNTPAEKHLPVVDAIWKEQHGLDASVIISPKDFPYRELIGCLLYIALCTRPDIANIVRELSKYAANPSKLHVEFAKRVLRYLQGTKSKGLNFSSKSPCEIVGYVDAAYADNVETARSTTGWLFKYGGAAVSWRSTCQKTVARSSCEAEYMAASAAVDEGCYLRQLLADFNPVVGPVTIFNDNQSALKIGNSVAPTKLCKHINIRYHNVREKIVEGLVKLLYMCTRDMPADQLTKNLGFTQLQGHRSFILGESESG